MYGLLFLGVAAIVVCLLICIEYERRPAPVRESRVTQTSGEVSVVPIYFPKAFHEDLMKRVIETFQAQRKEAAFQFAVLFLSEYRRFERISSNTDFLAVDSKNTDCERRTFPPDDKLSNYVTAGPQGSDHAEIILLGKLNTLMEKYGEQKCKTIVLYTWLLPCDSRQYEVKDCKTEIIERLGPWVNEGKQVILVYTSPMSDVCEEKEDQIVEDIRAEGIIVLKEKYRSPLPPLSA